jgi:WD40 repeat protein
VALPNGLIHADLFTLAGHTGWVYAVAYSPNGKLIASAGGGNPYWQSQGPDSVKPGDVIIWDTATGERMRTLQGHQHIIWRLAFSPDGRQLATTSFDGTARLWDVASGKELTRRTMAKGAYGVAFSPDGALFALGGGDGEIHVWEVGSGRQRFTAHDALHPVAALAFSPDGRRLSSIHCDTEWMGIGKARIWDVASGKEGPPLDTPSVFAGALAISPDGHYLAAGDLPGVIKLWDLATGRIVRTLPGHQGQVQGLAFSPDGLFLASASWDSTVRVWVTDTGKEALAFRGHVGQVRDVAFSPDGTRLVSGGNDGTVKVWDLTLHPEFASLQANQFEPMNDEIEALEFGPGGQTLTLARMGGVVVTFQPTEHTQLDCLSLDLTAPGRTTTSAPPSSTTCWTATAWSSWTARSTRCARAPSSTSRPAWSTAPGGGCGYSS